MNWALLEVLTEDVRRAVLAVAVRRRYKKGDTLFFEGDPGDTLHFLARGRVSVRVGTLRGDSATLAVLAPGDCFGEQALLDAESRRTASVVALEPAETLALHRRDFLDLQARHPEVNAVLVEVLAAQVRRLSTLVVEAHFVGADQRVVNRLADLADTFAPETSIPITQDDLASLAGTTRPTANRALQDLVDAGLVALGRGRIELLDVAALVRRVRR